MCAAVRVLRPTYLASAAQIEGVIISGISSSNEADTVFWMLRSEEHYPGVGPRLAGKTGWLILSCPKTSFRKQ